MSNITNGITYLIIGILLVFTFLTAYYFVERVGLGLSSDACLEKIADQYCHSKGLITASSYAISQSFFCMNSTTRNMGGMFSFSNDEIKSCKWSVP